MYLDEDLGHKHDGYSDIGVHAHYLEGVTTFDLGHYHLYAGVADFAPSGVQHTHNYIAYTSFDDRHKHFINGITGPAIFLTNGQHYHLISGATTINGFRPHAHHYSGTTSL